MWRPTGRRTAMGAGYLTITMAGLGSAMNRGVGRLITMATGFVDLPAGAGIRAPGMVAATGVRRWSAFLVLAAGRAASDSGSATWVGSRWRLSKHTAPGMAAAEASIL